MVVSPGNRSAAVPLPHCAAVSRASASACCEGGRKRKRKEVGSGSRTRSGVSGFCASSVGSATATATAALPVAPPVTLVL
jgi:hypothetical protein